jgi:hypothetical protein
MIKVIPQGLLLQVSKFDAFKQDAKSEMLFQIKENQCKDKLKRAHTKKKGPHPTPKAPPLVEHQHVIVNKKHRLFRLPIPTSFLN